MRVHLVDGTYELFRAHFSKRPPHADPAGRDLKATVGVVQSLLGLLDDPSEGVTHLAVAFDNPIVSFRNALFDGYKSDVGIPPELRTQFDDVEEAVAALGVVVWSMNEFEADDALAAAAAKFAQDPRVSQVRILTPDKDLGQCLRGERVVQVDRMRSKLITEASQRAEKRLEPESVPDFLALVGDTADGIPGIDGWGEKGTAEVLATYRHLEQIPRHPYEWKVRPRGAEKMAAALAAALDEAKLYRTLATLRTDVPLPQTLEQLEWQGVPRARFEAWGKKVGAELSGRVKRFSA
ncbi:MAG: polymerase [Myxococcaceae bacterium]|nr:polymerase [Myxococcaceae bacterium]